MVSHCLFEPHFTLNNVKFVCLNTYVGASLAVVFARM